MKYPIGTKIEFYGDYDRSSPYEYFEIEAYAIFLDGSTNYLVWSSYNEYGNQYDFFSEETLALEIKERKDCGDEVKIKEEYETTQ